MGYHRAGFEVFGVDNVFQPSYPFDFVQADALDVMAELLRGDRVVIGGEALVLGDFDLVHASPPCQVFSKTAHAHTKEHVDLLTPIRPMLIESGVPYIIENVEGAPLLDPVKLCATMFGLRAADVDGVELQLFRHRLFETSFPIGLAPAPCAHDNTIIAGVYGGSYHKKPEHRDDPTRRGGYTPAREVRAALLGIDWMRTEHELNQAIPPAYTEWLGHEALAYLGVPALSSEKEKP